jgi:DNA-binding MarR family transcriptional regulator
VVKVDPDFNTEYPDGDATSTEAYATLARVGAACLQELERLVAAHFEMPMAAATALAVLDGADEALTPSQISERLLVASATMTATLDLLERRDWVRRSPNPDDGRSTTVQITAEGCATTDRLLPSIRGIERRALSSLTKTERRQLMKLLAKVLESLADIAAEPPQPLTGKRVRPSRLNRPTS